MEKRWIVAIALCFVVLVAYQLLFLKPKPQTEAQQAAQVQSPLQAEGKPAAKPPAGEAQAPAKKPAPVEAGPAQAAPAVGAQAEQDVVVDTPLYTAVWTNKGAMLKSWKLKTYFNDKHENVDLVPARAAEVGLYPFGLRLEDEKAAADLNGALFDVSPRTLTLEAGRSEAVRFSYSDGKSLRAEKTIRFTSGTFALQTDIRVWINGQEVVPFLVWGPGIGNPSPQELKGRYTSSTGAAVYAGGKVMRMDERKYKPELARYNFVDWAGYEENYFAAIFVLPAGKGQAMFLKEEPKESKEGNPSPAFYLAASQPKEAFVGPKQVDLLKAFGSETRRIVNFGAFGAIADIMLIGVKFFYKLVPNWGVAIILLTILIKIIFFPLTYSSTKSMAKMADLQPKVKALRAKYKKAKTDINQRRQMNEEMMKLYKEHGVNPAGGCLPLLIQLPVFWGVFRMLVVSVEFRQAPFFLWIRDLSVKDPYYVTPILMGITQFISQKMTPSSADPSQARMMLIMPFIMTIFFMNFQSGLVLYWLTTNVLQIGQQVIMNKMMARQKRESDGKRK